jgi:hypothetical protein
MSRRTPAHLLQIADCRLQIDLLPYNLQSAIGCPLGESAMFERLPRRYTIFEGHRIAYAVVGLGLEPLAAWLAEEEPSIEDARLSVVRSPWSVAARDRQGTTD